MNFQKVAKILKEEVSKEKDDNKIEEAHLISNAVIENLYQSIGKISKRRRYGRWGKQR